MAEVRHAHSPNRAQCPACSPDSLKVGGKPIREDVMLPCAFLGYDFLQCLAERGVIAAGTGPCQC